MWSVPINISRRKFRTLELAKERVLKRYPAATFIDEKNYSIIYLRGKIFGSIVYGR